MMWRQRGAKLGASRLAMVMAAWLLMASVALAGNVSVQAYLQPDHAQLGDTVTLNIVVKGTTQASRPDVSALTSDFDMVGMSHNASINIVNGHSSVQTRWAIALRPRHAGTLHIPAFTVDGQTTQPLTLSVGAAPTNVHGGAGHPVFIKVKPSTYTPYVGQQIDLDVKLFYAPSIGSGSLDAPQGKGIDVQTLGKDSHYQTERSGRIYHVLERHYAVTAQHAGSIKLSPVTFYGTMSTPRTFGGFFHRGRTVSARSKSIPLAVRARPAAAGKGLWLPARKLTLTLTGLPADGHVKVGQSLTLTLTEQAVGLPFESLPTPQLPKLAGVDVYPDQSKDHTGNDGHWLTGTRTRKFALVPQQAGSLTIPAITLAWWNVQTGHKEVARIPAHSLTVVAAAGAASQPLSAAPATPATVHASTPAPAAKPVTRLVSAPAAAAPASTHWLAWLALGLWVVTVLVVAALWWWRHRLPSVTPPAKTPTRKADARRLHQAFTAAVQTGDVTVQCDSLLAWARAERPGLYHLGDVSAALDSPAQRDAIAALQRARYAGTAAGPSADILLEAFASDLAWKDKRPNDTQDAALPPLYP